MLRVPRKLWYVLFVAALIGMAVTASLDNEWVWLAWGAGSFAYIVFTEPNPMHRVYYERPCACNRCAADRAAEDV